MKHKYEGEELRNRDEAEKARDAQSVDPIVYGGRDRSGRNGYLLFDGGGNALHFFAKREDAVAKLQELTGDANATGDFNPDDFPEYKDSGPPAVSRKEYGVSAPHEFPKGKLSTLGGAIRGVKAGKGKAVELPGDE